MVREETSGTTKTAVAVPIQGESLPGDLGMPSNPQGVVLFAHGSGSSRHSPRNQYVARTLEHRNLATLLIDLLTPQERRSTTGRQSTGSTFRCSPAGS